MSFYSWASIEGFHNIRKHSSIMPEVLNGNPIVKYRSKIKLHGMNMGIQIHENGTVIPQSRTQNLLTADLMGFARWVNAEEQANKSWSNIRNNGVNNIIIYGEWVGNGVQKGVAISNIGKKIFAVFAARYMDDKNNDLVIEPEALVKLVGNIQDVFILPWHHKEYEIDFSKSNEELQPIIDNMNKDVFLIEQNDPWVEATFGIKGVGEGLVMYPVSKEHLGYINFNNLCFKAKGEEHKNIKTAKPVELDAITADGVEQFAYMVLTTARLEQGATAVNINSAFDMKFVAKFIGWISSDVEKETKAELEASKLEWKQVQRAIANKARLWYLDRCKSK